MQKHEQFRARAALCMPFALARVSEERAFCVAEDHADPVYCPPALTSGGGRYVDANVSYNELVQQFDWLGRTGRLDIWRPGHDGVEKVGLRSVGCIRVLSEQCLGTFSITDTWRPIRDGSTFGCGPRRRTHVVVIAIDP